MIAPFHCPKCGGPLPAVEASCNRCLLELGLQAEDKPDPDPGFLSEFPSDPTPPAHQTTASFPSAPADALGPDAPAHPFEEQRGDLVGNYRLLEMLGEGGFGMVWRAERIAAFQQEVAIKIVKPGMDTRAVVARFETERQALALMDHPNIAKVFDGGVTRTGRPYFVMELVRGLKITDYCDGHKFTTRQRLELFMEVCHAVHHAHQQGIIHRDLKPENILVTKYEDGKPVPKVIDFGMAKAISGQKLAAGAWPTSLREFLGSLPYMSPEQAEAGISAFKVDARTDIYSLGVVLYELFTGRTPFDAKRLSEVSQQEALRTIREEEPPAPSRRFTTLTGGEQAEIARSQQVEAPKLLGLMRRELDWIVMRALEKDRRDRFDSAADFAKDIKRHLTDQVTESRPPSAVNRLGKLFRRNKAAFAVGLLLTALLGAALASSLFVWNTHKRLLAQTKVASDVTDFFVNDLLGQADPRKQANARFTPDPNLTVRQALERASQQIEGKFRHDPATEATIRYSIGESLCVIGRTELAMPHLRRSVELFRASMGTDDRRTLKAMDALARAYQSGGQWDNARALFEETLRRRQSALGQGDLDTLASINNLASIYQREGNFDRAIPLFEVAFNQMQSHRGEDNQETLLCLYNLAKAWTDDGQYARALPVLERVLHIQRASLPEEHPDVLSCMNTLARAYEMAGRFSEALSLSVETAASREKVLGPEDQNTINAKGNLGWSYLVSGDLERALPLLDETLKFRQTRLGPTNPATLVSMHNLARADFAAGRLDQAQQGFEKTLRLRSARLGADHRETLLTMAWLGKCQLRKSDFANAETCLRACLNIREKSLTNDWRTFEAQALLGSALLGQRKYGAAEPLLLSGYAGLRARLSRVPAADQDSLSSAAERLVELYEAWHKPAEAAKWKQELKLLQERRAERPSTRATQAARQWWDQSRQGDTLAELVMASVPLAALTPSSTSRLALARTVSGLK